MQSEKWYSNYPQHFLSHVIKGNGVDDCWNFRVRDGAKMRYASVTFRGVKVAAHVMSYRLFNGEVPAGIFVCHRCDNPRCVNPHHLFLGTNRDNMLDMVSKGRNRDVAGVKNPMYGVLGSMHPSSKLTESNVMSIRESFTLGKTTVEIAGIYKITQGCVAAIVRGRTWRHLPFVIKNSKYGEGNKSSKLNEDNVREIRTRIANGETQRSVAADFGIAHISVARIVNGKSWKHLGNSVK